MTEREDWWELEGSRMKNEPGENINDTELPFRVAMATWAACLKSKESTFSLANPREMKMKSHDKECGCIDCIAATDVFASRQVDAVVIKREWEEVGLGKFKKE